MGIYVQMNVDVKIVVKIFNLLICLEKINKLWKKNYLDKNKMDVHVRAVSVKKIIAFVIDKEENACKFVSVKNAKILSSLRTVKVWNVKRMIRTVIRTMIKRVHIQWMEERDQRLRNFISRQSNKIKLLTYEIKGFNKDGFINGELL